jgi:HlyD family secretion protein
VGWARGTGDRPSASSYAQVMRKRLWGTLLVGTVALGGGVALAMRPPAVPVAHPQAGPIKQTVVVSGQVMPPSEIRLASLVASTAKEVLVDEGDTVTAGQVLVVLDDEDARAGVAQAEAQLASAKAGRVTWAKLNAPQAEADLRRAEANLEDARRRLAREKSLFQAGATTEASLEDAKTAEQLAVTQRDAAVLQVRAAEAGGSQSQTAQANVALAQAQLERAKVQLARHVVRSPTDGVVITRMVEPGDAVMSGSNLFLLSSTGQTRLRVEPDERSLALLAVGQTAIASAEAFPNDKFEAKVAYIAPAIDASRGTVEVRLVVANPPEFLRHNMTISVEITVAEKEQTLTVPRQSVLAEKREPHVLVFQGGRAEKRPVSLGLLGEEFVEIREGLSPEDLVVVAPPGTVAPGEAMRGDVVAPRG